MLRKITARQAAMRLSHDPFSFIGPKAATPAPSLAEDRGGQNKR